MRKLKDLLGYVYSLMLVKSKQKKGTQLSEVPGFIKARVDIYMRDQVGISASWVGQY